MPHAAPHTTETAASRVPTWIRHAVQRWTMPQLVPGDRMDPDMVNVMAHRPASARMRCMLSPLSDAGPQARG